MRFTRRDLLHTALLAPLAGCAEHEPEAPPAPAAETRPAEGRIDILLDGKPYSAFQFGEEWDKPFLHPLATPSGVVVTRGFPMQPLPGETQDHAWHRGIIWGHGLINGHDFWREQGRDKTARLALAGAVSDSADAGVATVEGKFHMLPPDGNSIGTCRQSFQIEKTLEGVQIDAWITVLADQGQAADLRRHRGRRLRLPFSRRLSPRPRRATAQLRRPRRLREHLGQACALGAVFDRYSRQAGIGDDLRSSLEFPSPNLLACA